MRTSSHRPDDEARLRALALSLASGVGPRGWRERVATFGSAAQAFDASVHGREREIALERAERAITDAARCGAQVLLLGDARYPGQLLELHDPPPVLFAIGDLSLVARRTVAIVGTRSATPYAERVTRRLAGAVARAGACVVSGMALGVDAVAHRAALEARAPTIAVLGTGVDVPYPVAHRTLHERIAREGLILSELPCGTRAVPGSFPRRNRVIAALAPVTLVTEAGIGSGALITAEHALDLSRTIAAVPGPIDVPQSAGTNRLLRDGAHVITDEGDLLTLLGLAEPRRAELPRADEAERRLLDALGDATLDLEALLAASGLPARAAMITLTSLELAGAIESTPGGGYRASRIGAEPAPAPPPRRRGRGRSPAEGDGKDGTDG